MQNRSCHHWLSLYILSVCSSISGWAGTYNVNSANDDGGSGTFRWAIEQLNTSGTPGTITFDPSLAGATINISPQLPMVTEQVTITGPSGGVTVSGQDACPIFYVGAPVTMSNISFANGNAVGGSGGIGGNALTFLGGGGGGGGAGMGGAIFVTENGNLIISNATFTSNKAIGGAGGSGGVFPTLTDLPTMGGTGGGGGGAMSGGTAGANSGSTLEGAILGGTGGGGGGGLLFNGTVAPAAQAGAFSSDPFGGTAGGNGSNPNLGGGDGVGGAAPPPAGGSAPGYDGNPGAAGGVNGGGGGGGSGGSTVSIDSPCDTCQGSGATGGSGGPYAGGGGGGGGGGENILNSSTASPGYGGPGGAGGFGGGGGGAGTSNKGGGSGGGGGFGGGGGGGGGGDTGANPWEGGGGAGGYGGGAGAVGGPAAIYPPIPSELTGPAGGGGGGAGLGGAIFVREGGGLTLKEGVVFPAGSNEALPGAAGNGATAGQGIGDELFIQSGSNLAFNVASGQTITITSAIASDNISPTTTFSVSGGGTVVLTQNSNLVTGAISIDTGTLAFTGAGALPQNSYQFSSGGTLSISGINASSFTVDDITGAGLIAIGSKTFNFGTANDTEYDGGFTGSGTANYIGSGQLTLKGVSSGFTGSLTIPGSLSDPLILSTNGSTSFDLGAGATLQVGSGTTIQADSAITMSNNLSLGTNTIDNNGNTIVINGNISGVTALTLTGSSSINLAGRNRYSGVTNLNEGTLILGSTSPIGSNTLNMADSTILVSGIDQISLSNNIATGSATGVEISPSTYTLTLEGVVSGSALITKPGSGNLVLAGDNTFTGGMHVTAGTITVENGSSLGGNSGGTIEMENSTTLNSIDTLTLPNAFTLNGSTQVDTNAFDLTISGLIGGAGSITKIGSDTLQLTNTSNSFSGGITVSQGTLLYTADSVIGAGTISLQNTATLQAGQSFTSSKLTSVTGSTTIDTLSNNLTIASNILGAGSITKIGSGLLTLSGTNSFSLGLTVGAGIVAADSDSLGTGPLQINGGGTFRALSNLTLAQNVIISSGGTTATLDMNSNDITLNGVLSGGSLFSVINGGNLILSGANTLSGGMSFSGSSAVLTLQNNTSLGPTTTLSAGNGITLELDGNLTIANPIITTTAFTIDTGSDTSTLSGIISGSAALTKAGSGTLVLSAANTYASTLLTDGTISVNNNSALGLGSVTMSDTTILQTENAYTLPNDFILNSGSAYFDSGSSSLTLNGDISGGGELVKLSAGTLTLAGDNSYSGGTNVEEGTLSLASATALGSHDLTLANNTILQAGLNNLSVSNDIHTTTAATINTGTFAFTLTGLIDGSGDITKSGTGSLTLTGVNTFSGGMNILAGTVIVNNSASLGTTGIIAMDTGTTLGAIASTTIPNDFILSGTTTFDPNQFTLTLTGELMGSGTLKKVDTGRLVLNADNSSYSGTISVSQGILSGMTNTAFGIGAINLSGGTTLQSGASITVGNDISLTGAVIFDTEGNDFQVDGVISGTGSLTKQDTGTLVFGGLNTYQGGTTIAAGSLSVIDGGALPTTGYVNIGASGRLDLSTTTEAVTIAGFLGSGTLALGTSAEEFTFGDGTNQSFTGDISGTRPMTKVGASTYSFTLNSPSYDGIFSINAGVVSINGTFGADVEVNPSGALKGTGRIRSLRNAGKVSPGNSIGTITINEGYHQTSSGTLVIELNAQDQNDQLDVLGGVELDGALFVIADTGTYRKDDLYNIIHASGTITGAFATNNLSVIPIPMYLFYETNDVFIGVAKSKVVFKNVIGYNPNIMKKYFESYDVDDSGLYDYLALLDFVSSIDQSKALDYMHPALFGGFGLSKVNMDATIAGFLTRKNTAFCCTNMCMCDGGSIWAQPFGQSFNVAGIDQQKGFKSHNYGIVAGFDGCILDNFSIGFAGGYIYSKLNWELSSGDGKIHSYFGAMYSDIIIDDGFINLSGQVGSDHFSANRNIILPGVELTAGNSHSGFDVGFHAGGGYSWMLPGDQFLFQPHAEFDYFFMQEAGYTESGAEYFNCNVEQKNTSYLRAAAGFLFARPIHVGESGCITPSLDIGYASLMPMGGNFYHGNIIGIEYPFMVRSFTEYWNLFLCSAGLKGTLTDRVEIKGEYSLETNGHYTNQILDFRIGVRF